MTAFGAVLAAAVAIASCGDSQPQHPIAAAVAKLQDAFVAGDVAGVCAGLSSDAQSTAGAMAHGDPKGCAHNVRRAFRLIAKGGGWEVSERPRVTAVRAGARRGTATIQIGDDWSADVPFVKRGGTWRLDGFFGTSRDLARSAVGRALATPRPAAGAEAVKVTSRAGRACPALRRHEMVVTGGCRFGVYAMDVPLYVLTPFGPFKFGDCDVNYSVRVDADGRAWNEDLNVRSRLQAGGCADVRACTGPERIPMSGTLGVDGGGADRLVHRISMCLETCVGYFAGELVMKMSRGERGWRARPLTGGGGRGGFWMDGKFVVTGLPRVSPAKGI